MLMRLLFLAVDFSMFCADTTWARSHHPRRHPLQVVASPAPAPYTGPTLVMHPYSNIACDTPYRSTRPQPCDQPVWVYGRPCEIDLGLGRYRSCD